MNAAGPEREAIAEEVSGLIERVTFHNDENGFCVLRVKVRGHRDEVTVIGSLSTVTAGEWLEAEGWWVRDKEHGLQFKARLMKTVPPTTVEGIERYLSSGLVKGIGPVLAKKLVGRFGAEVLGGIENRVAELQSVDGIGPTRRRRIEQAWQEAKQIREIVAFIGDDLPDIPLMRRFGLAVAVGDAVPEGTRENSGGSLRILLSRFMPLIRRRAL